MLALRGVVAGYGGGDVLQGVDIDVADGGIACIVGPNGAGKSTVLRAISGLLQPREGEITLKGEPIHRCSPAEILRRGVAQIPQSAALFANLTVRENVLLGAYIVRRDRALVRRRYNQVAELFPIVTERSRETAGNLSGRQRRMVEFARSLMLDPVLLLLDEPSLGLAAHVLSQIMARLKALVRERGLTVLLIEQNARSALSVADEAVVLSLGRVVARDRAERLLGEEELRRAYLGY
jgi:ABC-type branched-subunit amino acid transport system ATPase component